jgi:hypothetical protein
MVTLPERDCDLLRDLLIAEHVEAVVEVGLAYASSALAIGEALVAVRQVDICKSMPADVGVHSIRLSRMARRRAHCGK